MRSRGEEASLGWSYPAGVYRRVMLRNKANVIAWMLSETFVRGLSRSGFRSATLHPVFCRQRAHVIMKNRLGLLNPE